MDILKSVFDAGIVGCGGAGFPTHVKLRTKAEYLIINGAECEPLLRNDRYLMKNKALQIVGALDTMQKELGFSHVVIGLKEHYKKEVQALNTAIKLLSSKVEIFELESFYPAGDEQTLIYEVTGRVVPPAGLPGDVGVIVNNVATIYEIHLALKGYPFTRRYLTVTGEVAKPSIIHAPIGTPFSECIEAAGGALASEYFVVSGGPMMGRNIPFEDLSKEFVTKTTSGILVLPKDGPHANRNELTIEMMQKRAGSCCIQCSFCTGLCPRNMLGHDIHPHKVMRKFALGGKIEDMLDDKDIRDAQLCCECGICELYACPMGLSPRRINSAIRKALGAAGIKYERPDKEFKADPDISAKRAPTDRVASRAGVGKYNRYTIEDMVELNPQKVSIPLKMHVGAPCVPVVKPGDAVYEGTLIAAVPEGALGANIHAGIEGVVESITDKITIVTKG